jgi:pyruvate formate lyase activating enzyme
MKIGGLQRFSLIDYPDKICAIIFTQGCNFRCPYCHNPELADPDLYESCIPEEEVFGFLEKRKGKLDAVTVTGGEPTIQPDIARFLEKIKAMGYLVKIDSNGSRPEIIKTLIDKKLVNYIAMDIKAPLEKYRDITRSEIDPSRISESIALIMAHAKDYEFRTTVVKSLLSEDDIEETVKLAKGAKKYVLQRFVPSKTLERDFLDEETYSKKELDKIIKKLKYIVESIRIR